LFRTPPPIETNADDVTIKEWERNDKPEMKMCNKIIVY
jgi:hypothetical protein